MPFIELQTLGLTEQEQALVKMVAMLTDLRPFWPRLVPLFIAWMREQWETEGAWGGDPWEPLSETYAQIKERLHPGKGILYATGDLRKAASKPVRYVTPRTLTLVVDDSMYRHGGKEPHSVASFHQEGTSHMPARPIIPERLPTYAQAEVTQVAEEYVAEMARRIGLKTV